jgi:hypothetical protein
MGQYIKPTNVNFLSSSGGTVTGNTIFTKELSAATLNTLIVSGTTFLETVSAATIYSGSANISDIFISNQDIIDGGLF